MTLKIKLKFIPFLMAMLVLCACVEKEQIIGEVQEQDVSRLARSVSVLHILQNRDTYRDKSVTVSGVVSAGTAFEFVNEQPYRLTDDTGEIWVITSNIMPKEGSRITVKGKVAAPYQIKGRQYIIALVEMERSQ